MIKTSGIYEIMYLDSVINFYILLTRACIPLRKMLS